MFGFVGKHPVDLISSELTLINGEDIRIAFFDNGLSLAKISAFEISISIWPTCKGYLKSV